MVLFYLVLTPSLFVAILELALLVGYLLSSSSTNCWKISLGFRSILKSFVSKATLLIPLANGSSPTDGFLSYCTQRINALALLYTWVRSGPVGFFGKSFTK